MVKRLLACAVITATLLGPLAARAENVEGSILLPNPAAVLINGQLGLTEGGSACDPEGATQGIDGFWIALPGSATSVSLTTSDPIADLSLFFYDASCAYLSPIDDVLGPGNEAGAIPAGAEWVIVDMLVGANASFTVSIT